MGDWQGHIAEEHVQWATEDVVAIVGKYNLPQTQISFNICPVISPRHQTALYEQRKQTCKCT